MEPRGDRPRCWRSDGRPPGRRGSAGSCLDLVEITKLHAEIINRDIFYSGRNFLIKIDNYFWIRIQCFDLNAH